MLQTYSNKTVLALSVQLVMHAIFLSYSSYDLSSQAAFRFHEQAMALQVRLSRRMQEVVGECHQRAVQELDTTLK